MKKAAASPTFAMKKFALRLMVLIVLTVMGCGLAPRLATAAVTIPPDPCAATGAAGANGQLQAAFGNSANIKTQAANQILAGFGAINLEAQYCIQKIRDLLGTIQSTVSALSFNPFEYLVDFIVNAVVTQIITFIASACQTILSDLKSMANFAFSMLNKACIPLPDLNLGFGGLSKLNLGAAQPCNGFPLFGSNHGAQFGITPYDYRNFGR